MLLLFSEVMRCVKYLAMPEYCSFIRCVVSKPLVMRCIW